MCGRYTLTSPEEALRRLFGYGGPALNLPARYNVAPTQEMPVVRRGQDSPRALVRMRWGLIPSWAKDESVASKMINARAETLAEKPSFRTAFAQRRCLIPADGFYEWHTEAGVKQPYLIGFEDRRPFAFAGLWERWTKGEEPVVSFTIVTTEASETLRAVHHRMPVILAPEDFDAWLDTEGTSPAAAQTLLRTFDAPDFAARPVSTRVNNVRNDDPSVLEAA